jgi:hypothetical protein
MREVVPVPAPGDIILSDIKQATGGKGFYVLIAKKRVPLAPPCRLWMAARFNGCRLVKGLLLGTMDKYSNIGTFSGSESARKPVPA